MRLGSHTVGFCVFLLFSWWNKLVTFNDFHSAQFIQDFFSAHFIEDFHWGQPMKDFHPAHEMFSMNTHNSHPTFPTPLKHRGAKKETYRYKWRGGPDTCHTRLIKKHTKIYKTTGAVANPSFAILFFLPLCYPHYPLQWHWMYRKLGVRVKTWPLDISRDSVQWPVCTESFSFLHFLFSWFFLHKFTYFGLFLEI